MTGKDLRQYRRKKTLTQMEAAQELGVSQPYLSLLEKEQRPLSEKLKKKLVSLLELPVTELPSNASKYKVVEVSDDQLTHDLSALGYLGFSHWKPSRTKKNPADVLLSGLKADKRDARLMEAMPWLVLKFPEMKWNEVEQTAKMYDLQNRLGFVVSVARGMAESKQNKTAAVLKRRETELEPSMLVREGTLCNETMTNAERRWLVDNRSADAKHWRILASLTAELVRYDV